VQIGSLQAQASAPFTVGQFNVENFFPVGANKAAGVPVSPEQYRAKLAKLALAIDGELHNPDVLALEEIGNKRVIDDLLAMPALAAQGYQTVMLPTNDKRGINVALLYKPSVVTLDAARQENPPALPKPGRTRSHGNHGSNGGDRSAGGNIDPTKLFARPPLVVDVTVRGAAQLGAPDAPGHKVELIVNHFLSKLGGSKSDARREAQAKFVGGLVDSARASDAARGVIVLGDLNTEYGDQAYRDVITGANGVQRVEDVPVLGLPEADRYTGVYRGAHDMLDHMMVTPDLGAALTTARIPHFDSGDDHAHALDTTRPDGVSDHDPILASFDLAKLA
jgi:predicted extracellular nuclease